MSANEDPPRSLSCNQNVFLRFINTTDEEMSVIWLDYKGNRVPYKTLPHKNAFIDVNTFADHPWIFENPTTKDRFVVNKSEIFYPYSLKSGLIRAQAVPDSNNVRKQVPITYPLYSLRDCSLRIIRNCLEKPEDSLDLDLPQSLVKDIQKLVEKKNKK